MTTQGSAPSHTQRRRPTTGENILDAIHDNQTAAVDMAKQWVDRVGETIPDLWEKPIAEGTPAIQQLTDAAFDLTRRILDAQRDFSRQIVDSVVDQARKLD